MTVSAGVRGWWLDAAITPHGIPSSEASRVPGAIRRALTDSGAEVDQVLWGGGEGYESTRGRIYVKWKADKTYNAVDYADIARRIFQAAAEGFPAGAQLVMSRYRILRPIGVVTTLLGSSNIYVYPVGGALAASAPEVARRSSVVDLPLPPAADEPPMGIESDFARFAASVERETKVPLWGWGLIAGGAVVAIGGAVYWGTRKRPVANRRRRA
jgi:hypothetical protein